MRRYNTLLNLNELIETGFIKKSDAEILKKAMLENKNILIAGTLYSGKTTLLNSLLKFQEDSRIMIIENIPEIIVPENLLNNIITEDITSQNKNDLSRLLEFPVKRVVISEALSLTNRTSLITALNLGISVLSTLHIPPKNNCKWQDFFLSGFSGEAREYAQSTLNKKSFIVVDIVMDGNKREVVGVKEF